MHINNEKGVVLVAIIFAAVVLLLMGAASLILVYNQAQKVEHFVQTSEGYYQDYAAIQLAVIDIRNGVITPPAAPTYNNTDCEALDHAITVNITDAGDGNLEFSAQ